MTKTESHSISEKIFLDSVGMLVDVSHVSEVRRSTRVRGIHRLIVEQAGVCTIEPIRTVGSLVVFSTERADDNFVGVRLDPTAFLR